MLKNLLKTSIVAKLIFWILLIILVFSSAISYLSYKKGKLQLESQIFKNLMVIADHRAYVIKNYLDEKMKDFELLSLQPQVLAAVLDLDKAFQENGLTSPEYAATEKKIRPDLERFNNNNGFQDLFFVSPEGNILFSYNNSEKYLGVNLKTGIYHNSTLGKVFGLSAALLKVEVSEFENIDDSGSSAVFIAAPVIISDKIIGVAVLQIGVKELENVIFDYRGLGETGEMVVAKRLGNEAVFVMPARNDPGAAFKRIFDINTNSKLPIVQAVQGIEGNGFYIDYRGKKVLSAWRYLSSYGLGLVIKIDVQEAFAPIDKLRDDIFLLTIAIMLLCVGIAFFVAKSISYPIRALRKGVEIISGGNLDYKINVGTMDEIGQLSQAFNDMVLNLKKSTISIDTLNKEIIEREEVEKELQKKKLELYDSLKEALKSREILTSMLEDNNIIREKISQSEETFRNIFDEAGDGILIADPRSKKFYMSNKAICRMLAYSKEEIKNLEVGDIHPENDVSHILSQFERQAKGEFNLLKDVPVKRKDGSVFYADINATTIEISGKTYLMGIFHDITEHREIEYLKKVDQLKKNFISNMSHELRTPLNAVIGFSEVLVDQKFGALNETQKDYLNDILESGKFLLSLINDILDLSKIEAGKAELVISNFSIKDLLGHSLILVKEKALKHNIELSLEIAEDVDFIRADERKVKQIIFNLLSNAVKFTPDGGKVGIKARINGSEVEVIVWDTGIGISKENQEKLFKPFMQLDISPDKKYTGTGLGLSLAKELVELHKGKIWVESEGRDKGSNFKFSLPIEGV